MESQSREILKKIARPAGPGKKKIHRRATEEKTANDDARGRAAPVIPTAALVPSGAGEVVLAQVNGGRIVGRSGTSDSWAAYRQNVAAVFAQFRDERLSESTVGVLMGTTHARITEEESTQPDVRRVFLQRIQETRRFEGRWQQPRHADRAGLPVG